MPSPKDVEVMLWSRNEWCLLCTRCDQKVLDPICFGEINQIKIFVSWSFDLIEGHWKCEKHYIMLGCLCKPLLRE